MDIFDKITDAIIDTGKEVSQKAKIVGDVAKLQYEIKNQQDFIDKKFQELGRKYYEAHKEDEPAEDDSMEEIETSLARMKELQEQLMEVKGAKLCPKCGAKIPDNALFCSTCGAKVDSMFEEE